MWDDELPRWMCRQTITLHTQTKRLTPSFKKWCIIIKLHNDVNTHQMAQNAHRWDYCYVNPRNVIQKSPIKMRPECLAQSYYAVMSLAPPTADAGSFTFERMHKCYSWYESLDWLFHLLIHSGSLTNNVLPNQGFRRM